jgi:polyisoprenoid-binding protein YceI
MKLLMSIVIAFGVLPLLIFQKSGIVLPQTTMIYRLDGAQSQFMVRAPRSGLLWFKGHAHFIKVGDFTGDVEITPDVINPASLRMTVRADSLEETGANFTPQQKQIIKKELDEIVLESAKYPVIIFRSTDVSGKFNGRQFEAEIGGELTLHGVTRRVRIPAIVTFNGNDLRAKGEFTINRKAFNVKATNAFHGLVRVKHELKFTFDIVAHKV